MLFLVDDKIQAIREAKRLLKRAVLQVGLSWKEEPTEDFFDFVSTVLCSYCMRKAETYEGWKEVFKKDAVQEVKIIKDTFKDSGVLHMLKVEGLVNAIRILSRYIGNSDVRKRMKLISAAFKE